MLDYNHYFTNKEIKTILHQWEKDFPKLIKVEEIGRSFQDRPIWLMKITNQETGCDLEKPAFYIDANIHATEIAGPTTALRVAESLLTRYPTDDRIQWLLDNTTYYIIPRVNPDGAKACMADHPHFVRSSMRPYPFDEMPEGLQAQDITGDGRVRQMRIKDPSGDWKVSPDDARLLVKREPTEIQGEFYRLFQEGFIEEYDGDIIKVGRPKEGLDMNRNFPFEYQPNAQQRGAGDFAAQEPETRALIEFIIAHPNINAGVALHTYSRVILRPYSTKADEDMPVPDLRTYKMMGELGTKITGYRHVSVYHDFRYEPNEVITGVFDDWMYDSRGAFGFTMEQWDLPTAAGIKDRKFIEWFQDHPAEEDVQILRFADEHNPEGCVAWKKFDHPQLGEVEIGGWDLLYTWRNPPHALMDEESRRNAEWMIELGFLMPKLALVNETVTSLGKDTFAVKLVFENIGFLPTYGSEAAQKRKLNRPIRANILLPKDASLVVGKKKMELDHLQGRSNKLELTSAQASSPMDNRAKVEWTIKAPAGSKVKYEILTERAGVLRGNVELK
ncbi:MAG: M14 family metallopeptidase [Anaerolineae bacterium]|jgi:murein tripeptide amidase MpaA|nr:M14 family metallopeptidase [Anaerolineae bacterium]